MADKADNLMRAHLKRLQTGQERIEQRLIELTRRIARMKLSRARFNAIHEESYAEQSVKNEPSE